jgi:hypothetical protein
MANPNISPNLAECRIPSDPGYPGLGRGAVRPGTPDAGARRDLYEILEERYGRRSTILTSQIPVDKCGDPTYADAVLDRLVHNAHRIDLAGDSLRRRRPRSTPKD